MTTWVEGKVYDYYGTPIRCVRRWFDGALELVDLTFELDQQAAVVGDRRDRINVVEHPLFTRAAMTLGSCVVPRVTETLGGVLRPDLCDHRYYGRVTANAGPFVGRVCCDACGAPPDEPLDSETMGLVIEAVERRAQERWPS